MGGKGIVCFCVCAAANRRAGIVLNRGSLWSGRDCLQLFYASLAGRRVLSLFEIWSI